MNSLHPDWQIEAKRLEEKRPIDDSSSLTVEFLKGFKDGSTLMRDRVEKMLKDNLAQINKDLKAAKDREDIIGLNGEKTAVEILLTDLKNITPND